MWARNGMATGVNMMSSNSDSNADDKPDAWHDGGEATSRIGNAVTSMA